MNIKIADRLVELRKKNGYSQEQLADKLGLSRQAVSKWERAEASPDTDNLICLAKLYGVSLDDLLSTDESIEDIAQETKEKEEEKKTISTNGIHIEDDGDQVHIDNDGIHIQDKDGDKVEINGKGIHINGEKKEKDPKEKTYGIIMDSLYGLITLSATVTYLLLGVFLPNNQGWTIWWVLFLLIPVIPSIVKAIHNRKITDFLYPVAITFVYCYLGMAYGLWHPWWVLFITIPVFYLGFGVLDRLIHRNDPNWDKDDDDE